MSASLCSCFMFEGEDGGQQEHFFSLMFKQMFVFISQRAGQRITGREKSFRRADLLSLVCFSLNVRSVNIMKKAEDARIRHIWSPSVNRARKMSSEHQQTGLFVTRKIISHL